MSAKEIQNHCHRRWNPMGRVPLAQWLLSEAKPVDLGETSCFGQHRYAPMCSAWVAPAWSPSWVQEGLVEGIHQTVNLTFCVLAACCGMWDDMKCNATWNDFLQDCF